MKNFIYKKVSADLSLEASLYKAENTKGVLLYFHGGGFLYGGRNDLPAYHIARLNEAGYSILAFDYRLAPETSFSSILQDALDGIKFFNHNKDALGFSNSPYFLWGRSAGAYLALLAAREDLSIRPSGIISYYGYGFTVEGWYREKSDYYLQYPVLKRSQVLDLINDHEIGSAHIHERFPLYLYARQNGAWLSMISNNREEEFIKNYSLLNLDKDFQFPPTFLAHSLLDKDVPYEESIGVSKIIKNHVLFTCSSKNHDFDRNVEDKNTIDLLNKSIGFLNDNI